MDMRGYQRYREDSLNTMTQGELLLLLCYIVQKAALP